MSICKGIDLEKRLMALEDSATDQGLKVVVVLDGETTAEAITRLELRPDARAVFLTELDERI